MKIKKITVLLAIALSCACHKNPDEPTRANTVIKDNLYGIEYDDFDFEAGIKYYERHKPDKDYPGCSEVRLGDFVGRNMDYYINRNAAAVIKVNGGNGRLASVGVVGCSKEFNSDLAASGEQAEIYKYLPMRTCDGINEKGVYIGVNVMPTGETSLNRDNWRSEEWGVGAAFTRPGAEHCYPVLCLVRFVLDNAVSVQDAIDKISMVNWYEPVNYPSEGHVQAFHWMLADKDRNCVLEFLENHLIVTEADDLRAPSFGTIMTNFTNACRADNIWQDHGAGFERWDVLAEAYPTTPESFSGMEKLMQKVWYSKFYTTPILSDDFWISEIGSSRYKAWELYGHHELLREDLGLQALALVERALWEDKEGQWFTDGSQIWFTVHNSIYNLIDKKFEVIVHEGMFDQKEYLTFDLNSTFNKPRI